MRVESGNSNKNIPKGLYKDPEGGNIIYYDPQVDESYQAEIDDNGQVSVLIAPTGTDELDMYNIGHYSLHIPGKQPSEWQRFVNHPRGRATLIFGGVITLASIGAIGLSRTSAKDNSSSPETAPTVIPSLPTPDTKETLDKNQVILNMGSMAQGHPLWAYQVLGNNPPRWLMKDWGCLVTALSDQECARGKPVTPYHLNLFLKKAGAFGTNDGIYNPVAGDKALGLKITDECPGNYASVRFPDEHINKVVEHISNGHPVLTRGNFYDMGEGGHHEHYYFTMGWEKDSGTGNISFLITDPRYGKVRKLSWEEYATKTWYYRVYDVNLKDGDFGPKYDDNKLIVEPYSDSTPINFLTMNKRPEMIKTLDQGTQAWWEWLMEGNVSYETLWYIHDCEINGIPPSECSTPQHMQAKPPIEHVLASLTVQMYGGAPLWDTLTQKLMETKNHTGPHPTSDAGAMGPYQIKKWAFDTFGAYPGDVQNPYDAAFTASNLLVFSNMLASKTESEAEYAHNYAGRPCDQPNFTKCTWNPDGTYGTAMWNHYPGMGNAAYRLAVQLRDSWLQFQV